MLNKYLEYLNRPLFFSSVIVVLETSGRLPFQRKSFTIDVSSSRYLFGKSRASSSYEIAEWT